MIQVEKYSLQDQVYQRSRKEMKVEVDSGLELANYWLSKP